MSLDVAAVRADFPALSTQVNGKPLVYLDNAASAQKPNQVIDGTAEFLPHVLCQCASRAASSLNGGH
jgi:cysteine desulfurase/selenocysteine lyase